MRNIFRFITLLFNGVIKYRTLIPKGFVIIFTVITAIIIGFQHGFREGIMALVRTVFMAELVINQNVTLAINADPSYTIFAFLQIINALFIIYILVKLIAKGILVGLTGSQAPYSAYLVAIGLLGVLEMAAIGWLEHTFFIPLWDGIIFLFLNLSPVFSNINWWSWTVPSTPDIGLLNETTTTVQNNITKTTV